MKKTKIKKDLSNKFKEIGSENTIRGITLISLVITIITLLILAGITLNMLLGENGIMNKTKTAKYESEKQTASETMTLKITECQMKSYAENGKLPDLQYVADKFCEDNDMQYVTVKHTETGSLEKVTVGATDSILTKLKAYPYEFEIDNELKLASIDGVQVASTEVNALNSEIETLKSQINTLQTQIENLNTNVTRLEEQNVNANNSIQEETLFVSSGLASGTGTFVEGKKASDYNYLIVTCATEQGKINTLIPTEQLGESQMMARFSDNNTGYYARIKFTINDTNVVVHERPANNGCYCNIIKIVGISY